MTAWIKQSYSQCKAEWICLVLLNILLSTLSVLGILPTHIYALFTGLLIFLFIWFVKDICQQARHPLMPKFIQSIQTCLQSTTPWFQSLATIFEPIKLVITTDQHDSIDILSAIYPDQAKKLKQLDKPIIGIKSSSNAVVAVTPAFIPDIKNESVFWSVFLKQIKSFQWGRSMKHVYLCLPLEILHPNVLKESAKLIEQIQHVLTQVSLHHKRAKINIIITHLDQVPGMVETFRLANSKLQNKTVCLNFHHPNETSMAIALKPFIEEIEKSIIQTIHFEPDLSRRQKIFTLPFQIKRLILLTYQFTKDLSRGLNGRLNQLYFIAPKQRAPRSHDQVARAFYQHPPYLCHKLISPDTTISLKSGQSKLLLNKKPIFFILTILLTVAFNSNIIWLMVKDHQAYQSLINHSPMQHFTALLNTRSNTFNQLATKWILLVNDAHIKQWVHQFGIKQMLAGFNQSSKQTHPHQVLLRTCLAAAFKQPQFSDQFKHLHEKLAPLNVQLKADPTHKEVWPFMMNYATLSVKERKQINTYLKSQSISQAKWTLAHWLLRDKETNFFHPNTLKTLLNTHQIEQACAHNPICTNQAISWYTEAYKSYWYEQYSKLIHLKIRLEQIDDLKMLYRQINKDITAIIDPTKTYEALTKQQLDWSTSLMAIHRIWSSNEIKTAMLALAQAWFVLKHQDEPQKAAYFATNNMVNGYQSTPIDKLIDMNDQLNSPIQGWISTITDKVWQDMLYQSASFLQTIWQAEITKRFDEKIKPYYPFKQSSKRSVKINDFESFFKPNGQWDQFVNQWLSPFLDDKGQLKVAYQQSLPIHSDIIQLIPFIKYIQSIYFPNQSDKTHIELLLDTKLDNNTLITFQLGQKRLFLDYLNRPIKLIWPNKNPGYKILIEDDKGTHNYTDSDPWGLIRWLFSCQQTDQWDAIQCMLPKLRTWQIKSQQTQLLSIPLHQLNFPKHLIDDH
ncbi:hypothetical protein N9Y17_01895 [Gammaproteobacteria bacterium]|nr:hypothetical protein [Gammaproteobacteria bacterium]